MRIRAFAAIAIFVVAAMVGVYAADQGAGVNDKPQWRTMVAIAALALLMVPAALGVRRRRGRGRGVRDDTGVTRHS